MSSSRRGRLRAALAIALALPAAVLWAVPSEASTYDGVSIEIISPTGGSTLGGAVSVTYVVTAPADAPLGRAWADFGNADAVEVDLTGRDCSAGCEQTATFDTSTAPLPISSDAARYRNDGASFFGATVNLGDVSISDSVNVVLDNQRPTVTVVGQGDGYLTARDSVTIQVQPQARPGGTITGVFWVGGTTQTPMTAPATPGGPWTTVIDTSGARNGPVYGYVRATDDRGIQSIGDQARYVVDHGVTLTAPTLADPVVDDDLNGVDLGYTWGRFITMPQTTLRKVVTLLDGVQTYDDTDAYTLNQHPDTFRALSNTRVPAGSRVLTYVVTDSRGVTSRIDVPVHVQASLSATWTMGADTTVLPGAPVDLQAHLTSTHDTIWTWSLGAGAGAGDQGTSYGPCTVNCTSEATAAATLRFDNPGVHDVHLEVVPKNGWPLTFHTTVTVLPTATGRVTTTEPSTYGVRRTVAGVLTTSDGKPAPRTSASLQQHVGSTWTTVAKTTSDRAGKVAFHVTPHGASRYRIVTGDLARHWGGTIGPVSTLSARARVLITSAPSSVVHGRTITVKARAYAPRTRSLVLEYLDNGRWRAIGTAHPNPRGVVTWHFVPPAPGTLHLRATRLARDGLLETSSSTVQVRQR